MKLEDYVKYLEPMKRWREFWTASIGQTAGTGKTRQVATDNLFATIKASLDGSFTPGMIFHKGRVALIWRDGDQWFYHIREIEQNGPVTSNIHCIGDLATTEKAARNHLADYALDTGKFSIEQAASIIGEQEEFDRFVDNAYQSKRVQTIMQEQNCTWERAWEIEYSNQRQKDEAQS